MANESKYRELCQGIHIGFLMIDEEIPLSTIASWTIEQKEEAIMYSANTFCRLNDLKFVPGIERPAFLPSVNS